VEQISISLADPAGSSALVAAVQWLQGTLLGTVATTVAVTTVASVGLMMLSGRTNYRHGAAVIVGCFVIFGASSIVAGLTASMSVTGAPEAESSYSLPPPATPPIISARPPSAPYDPYAGASVR
jgi:type IV secretory pathway VirB2 component (pilin)